MILSGLQSWIQKLTQDPVGTIIELILYALALLLSLILHEIGHGYAALKCGDPTAKMMGRLTLDPRKHLDPIGMVCMILLRIGWAKPVPINPRNFRHYRRDMILVSFAGIIVNLCLFIVSCFLYVALITKSGGFFGYLRVFLEYMIGFNISLAVFNLLPVPPLDGYRIVNEVFFGGNLRLDARTTQIVHTVFLFVCLSGVLSTAFSRVCSFFIEIVLNFFVGLMY